MFDLRKAVFAVCLAGISPFLFACGSSNTTKPATSARVTSSPSQPGTVAVAPPTDAALRKALAHVNGKPITLADVRHLMEIATAPTPLPDPPTYAGCVVRTRAEVAKSRVRVAAKTEAQLKQTCKKRYEELLQTALSTAIHRMWIFGEAAEEHLGVTDQEVQQEFDSSAKASFGTEAKFEAYRKGTRETISDMKGELRLSKLTDKILKGIRERERPVDAARVTSFYTSHRSQFAIPEGRTVRIVRTATKGAASKAKDELQSGESFASVARSLATIAQPAGAKNGTIADLKPGVIEEKKLNDAIFSARPNRLYGPLELTATHKTIAGETNTGFFLFEVTGTVPGGQRPLSQVKTLIADELTKNQEFKSFTGFVAAFRRKWTARTDCEPGYIVKNCKQFKLSKAQAAIELHAL